MIGPPNFPSYNLSTCNLPHQRPQPFRFSHLLPSPSQLCDKPQSFSRDFFTSKQSRKTKAHPVSVPFQSGQSPSTHPQRHSQPPFPKQTVPAPDGIDLAWSGREMSVALHHCRHCDLAPLPLPCPDMPSLHCNSLPHAAPISRRRSPAARGPGEGHLRWFSPTAAPGVAGLAYTRNPTAERGASFLVMKSTTRNSASTPSSLITCSRCYSSGPITIIPSFRSKSHLISHTLPSRSLPQPFFLPLKPELRLSADSSHPS